MKKELPSLVALIAFVLLMLGVASCIQTCSGAECPGGTCPPGYHTPDRVMASVRLGKRGGCSGTIIRIHGKNAWGLSAAHCASRVGATFAFGNPDGTEGRGRWLAIDRTRDLSLFVAWSKDVKAAVKVPAMFTPDWSLPIEAVGYTATQGPKWKLLRYRTTHIVTETGTGRRFRRALFELRHGPFAPGDSGGGCFYDGSHLVGVMTHSGADMNVATHRQVIAFLRDNREEFNGVEPFQGWLPKQPRPGWSPTPNVPIIPKPDRNRAAEKLQQQIDELKAKAESEREKSLDALARAEREADELRQQVAALKPKAEKFAAIQSISRPPEKSPQIKTMRWVVGILIAAGLVGLYFITR